MELWMGFHYILNPLVYLSRAIIIWGNCLNWLETAIVSDHIFVIFISWFGNSLMATECIFATLGPETITFFMLNLIEHKSSIPHFFCIQTLKCCLNHAKKCWAWYIPCSVESSMNKFYNIGASMPTLSIYLFYVNCNYNDNKMVLYIFNVKEIVFRTFDGNF